MKKFLIAFIGILVVTSARADIAQYGTLTNSSSGTVAAAAPKYSFNTITSDDQAHIASTAYVKGAHNTALTAVNYLSDNKTGTTKTIASGTSGPVITDISLSSTGVEVTKGQITVPVGNTSGSGGQAIIWIQ